ncbi:DsbA family protein [Gephyromycinifex aptenodytis]|uniref:DsbA family protein n=1 Tax=Gephyromycinifex aptenodytis TaxID=2716227 RepID=UPI0014472911|nr:thioredoxin domain-containing protein [Gephyromycinifex aptenodytis]
MTSGKASRKARQATDSPAAPQERKRKSRLGLILALVVLAAIAAAIYAGSRGDDSQGAGPVPRGAVSDSGGIMLNSTPPTEGVPVLDVYEDFQCHWCKTFHEILGPRVQALAASGEAKVVLHLKTSLDRGKEGGESMRIANAAACASDAGPQSLATAHDLLMAAQPSQENPQQGWPSDLVSSVADQAGISGQARTTFEACTAQLHYRGYLTRVDEQSARDGVKGTPTYRIDGNEFDLSQVLSQDNSQHPEALDAAIAEAAKN